MRDPETDEVHPVAAWYIRSLITLLSGAGTLTDKQGSNRYRVAGE